MNTTTLITNLSDPEYVEVIRLCREAQGARPGYTVQLPSGVRFRSEHISSIDIEFSTTIKESTCRPQSARIIVKLDHHRKVEQ